MIISHLVYIYDNIILVVDIFDALAAQHYLILAVELDQKVCLLSLRQIKIVF